MHDPRSAPLNMFATHGPLAEQKARCAKPRPAVLEIALPYLIVDRQRSAAAHCEHGDHHGPKHAEFVTAFRQCPYITDLKMAAP